MGRFEDWEARKAAEAETARAEAHKNILRIHARDQFEKCEVAYESGDDEAFFGLVGLMGAMHQSGLGTEAEALRDRIAFKLEKKQANAELVQAIDERMDAKVGAESRATARAGLEQE